MTETPLFTFTRYYKGAGTEPTDSQPHKMSPLKA